MLREMLGPSLPAYTGACGQTSRRACPPTCGSRWPPGSSTRSTGFPV